MDDTESTTTSADENTGNLCDNPTRDTLAEGLLGLLKPTVDQLDDRVRATRISQLELKQQIDSLNEELLKVREALNNHPDLDPYVKKLIACKHKVTVVLNVLQASQDRLNEIRRMINKDKPTQASILSEPAIKPEQSTKVGSGSGVVITAFSMAFPTTICFSTDINYKACDMTKSTAINNNISVETVNMDLASSFIGNKFDIIIFNPPYVVTESKECGGCDITASWAGGVKGREITDRLLDMIPKILTDEGIFYLLLIEENIPNEVITIMLKYGYKSEIVMRRRVRNEDQLVLKFYKN
ncbi:unnamed protein product [Parnassius mnemosyne]|uniref:Methyltransferase HEMK2 n=1 Tax=Parnassius mnemosyne TaxID=213953 RepID=A0AAV1KQ64_9NEOP